GPASSAAAHLVRWGRTVTVIASWFGAPPWPIPRTTRTYASSAGVAYGEVVGRAARVSAAGRAAHHPDWCAATVTLKPGASSKHSSETPPVRCGRSVALARGG